MWALLHFNSPQLPWFINGVGLLHFLWCGNPWSLPQKHYNESAELLGIALWPSTWIFGDFPHHWLHAEQCVLRKQWNNDSTTAVCHFLGMTHKALWHETYWDFVGYHKTGIMKPRLFHIAKAPSCTIPPLGIICSTTSHATCWQPSSINRGVLVA